MATSRQLLDYLYKIERELADKLNSRNGGLDSFLEVGGIKRCSSPPARQALISDLRTKGMKIIDNISELDLFELVRYEQSKINSHRNAINNIGHQFFLFTQKPNLNFLKPVRQIVYDYLDAEPEEINKRNSSCSIL